jgi:hypothetical protein
MQDEDAAAVRDIMFGHSAPIDRDTASQLPAFDPSCAIGAKTLYQDRIVAERTGETTWLFYAVK